MVPELPVLVAPGGGLRLRPWRPADAEALVAAWSVADIAGQARGGDDRTLAGAAHWIAGAPSRAAAGLAVDLVVGPATGPEVWGEVGVVRRRLRSAAAATGEPEERTVWEVGWWIRPEARGHGRAEAAVRCVGPWLAEALGIEAVVARIAPANGASRRVARRLGLVRQGRFDDDHDLWVGPVPGPGGGVGSPRP